MRLLGLTEILVSRPLAGPRNDVRAHPREACTDACARSRGPLHVPPFSSGGNCTALAPRASVRRAHLNARGPPKGTSRVDGSRGLVGPRGCGRFTRASGLDMPHHFAPVRRRLNGWSNPRPPPSPAPARLYARACAGAGFSTPDADATSPGAPPASSPSPGWPLAPRPAAWPRLALPPPPRAALHRTGMASAPTLTAAREAHADWAS